MCVNDAMMLVVIMSVVMMLVSDIGVMMMAIGK